MISGPYESDADWFPVLGIVGVERSYAIVETSSHGRILGRKRRPAVHPPDRPLPRLGVERSWSHAAVSAAWNLEYVVVDISVPTHQWLAEQCPFEFDPLVTVDEALLQLSMMNSPVPH